MIYAPVTCSSSGLEPRDIAKLRNPVQEKAPLLALALIFVGAGALRFYGLQIQPFWNDEFNTWGVASQDTLLGVMDETSGVHPWGYFLVVHASRTVLGDAEWALRLPSAIAGALAVPAIYALGSRLYSYREGLVAALMLALSREPLHQSQEARMYSVLVLSVILCAYLWVPILRALRAGERPPLGSFIGYVLVAAACAYTHNFGILFVFLQGCYALFCTRSVRALGWLVAGYGLVVLLYAPAIPRLLGRASLGQANLTFTQRPGLAELVQFMGFVFDVPVGLRVVFALLLALLLALGVYKVARGGIPMPTQPGVLLWAWLVGPLAAVIAISWLWTPIWVDRYLVIVLPAAYLLLARALVELPALLTGRYAVSFACAVGLCGVLVWSLLYPTNYYAMSQQDTRGAIRYVAEREDAEYLYYCMGARPEYANYYLRGSGKKFRSQVCSVKDARELERSLEGSGVDSFYYVDLTSWGRTPTLQYLEANYDLTEKRKFYGKAKVYRFSTLPG